MASIHLTDMHSVHSARRIKDELGELIEFLQTLDMSHNEKALPKLRAHIGKLKALQVVYYNAIEEQVEGTKKAMERDEQERTKVLSTKVDREKLKKAHL